MDFKISIYKTIRCIMCFALKAINLILPFFLLVEISILSKGCNYKFNLTDSMLEHPEALFLYLVGETELDMKRHNGKLIKLFELNKYDRLVF